MDSEKLFLADAMDERHDLEKEFLSDLSHLFQNALNY